MNLQKQILIIAAMTIMLPFTAHAEPILYQEGILTSLQSVLSAVTQEITNQPSLSAWGSKLSATGAQAFTFIPLLYPLGAAALTKKRPPAQSLYISGFLSVCGICWWIINSIHRRKFNNLKNTSTKNLKEQAAKLTSIIGTEQAQQERLFNNTMLRYPTNEQFETKAPAIKREIKCLGAEWKKLYSLNKEHEAIMTPFADSKTSFDTFLVANIRKLPPKKQRKLKKQKTSQEETEKKELSNFIDQELKK